MRSQLSFLFLLFFVCLLSAANIMAEEKLTPEYVEIYANAAPGRYGQTADRREIIKTNLFDFLGSETLQVDETAETALLISKETVKLLETIAAMPSKSNENLYNENHLYVEKLDTDVYRISYGKIGFSGTFRFQRPLPALISQIKTFYRNTYWQEEVESAYRENYVITVIEAEDITRPYGRVDFIDAMITATLMAAKDQPLWGMHNGAGLLDGLGYMLVEQTNRMDQVSSSYRNYDTNNRSMEEMVLRLRQNRNNLAEDIHTSVNSIVQYEEDERFLLPEELLSIGEGDEIEFALTYYDLAVRSGCDAKLLALSNDTDQAGLENCSNCSFITVFQTEKFGQWGYIRHRDFSPPFTDHWEDIPALILRDNTFYFELDPAVIMHKRAINLSILPAWAISIY